MNKKTLLLILLLLFCLSLLFYVSYVFNRSGTEDKGNQPEDSPPEIPEGPEFVIPESPVGVLGLISALVAAFITFAVAKKAPQRAEQ